MTRSPGVAAAQPCHRYLVEAGVRGRSRKASIATATGRSWPWAVP